MYRPYENKSVHKKTVITPLKQDIPSGGF